VDKARPGRHLTGGFRADMEENPIKPRNIFKGRGKEHE